MPKGKKGFQKGHKGFKGTEKTQFKKGQSSWNKGLKMFHSGSFKKGHGRIRTEESYKKGSEKMKGSNHPNWRGGKSFEKYPKEFFDIRETILIRDKYTCQLCDDKIKKQTKNKFISVHHIDYNKKNNSENNLIALCNFCNSSVNFNRGDWIKHFKTKLNFIQIKI